ncbi:MAG TPA: ABC transporter permease [Pyrinomonadaceae bacterium]
MRNPLHTPFAAIFQNELILNSKRVAPYAMMLLFTANAVLWWIQPAIKYGWATNSDWYIVRGLLAFSFLLGMPIFNSVIMGDPVIRDFRLGVDPLIFSKPVSRAHYLLGKFFGNFFVLVCCQAVFPVTQLLLQAFPIPKMIVLPVRVFPYFKHFFFFLVITHLFLAALYFAAGTVTRNSKIVYGLAVCFYPIIIAYGLFVLRPLPFRWRFMLDPLLLGASLPGNGFMHSAEFLNQYSVPYTADMISNRVVMIGLAAVCLLVLYFRFSIVERTSKRAFSVFNLAMPTESIQFDRETAASARVFTSEQIVSSLKGTQSVLLPKVATANQGLGANLRKLGAATTLELFLLRAEKSLLVLIPLGVLISFLSLPFSTGASDVSPSAGFAGSSARGTLIFLLGVIVFYAGEAMHRDREVKVEPGLWSTPAPDSVFLLSKFLATIVLAIGLLLLIGLTAILTQWLRGQLPIDLGVYLLTYGLIVIPSLIFIAATSIVLNVLLREKYVTYVVIIAASAGLFYLYSQGFNNWLYNPMLYGLWTEADLGSWGGLSRLIGLRAYGLAIAGLSLVLAHVFFARRSTRRWMTSRRRSTQSS